MMPLMMIRLVCTISLTMLVAMLGAPAASATDGRIIGGDKVPQGTLDSTYSSVVSVRATAYWGLRSARPAPDLQSHVCGGTVIAPRLVLTAAHCVTGILPVGTGSGLSVLAGRAVLSPRTWSPGVRVSAVYVHPRFEGNRGDFSFLFGPNASTPAYDIAVLRLTEPIEGVTPMPLVQPDEDDAIWGAGAGRVSGARTLGWGFTRAPGNRARRNDALHAVELAIRADRRCERTDEGLGADARDFERATMLCAGTADGPGPGSGKAACFGDSGGPLLAPAADGSLRIVGVASWTSNRQPCRGWSVFARVATLREWIASIPLDEGGANGLLAPREISTTSVGANDLRVSWSASPSADVSRYRVVRATDGTGVRFFGPYGVSFLLEAASTDATARSIDLDGVEPQRPGQNERRLIRVDVEDSVGNRVAGRALRVAAPIDARPPTSPGTPRFLDRRGKRGESLLVRASADADCVAGYGVQLRTDRGWRSIGTWRNQGCDPLLTGSPFGWYPQVRPTSRMVLPLRQLDAGRHRVRTIAFDRAGNGVASRSIVIKLDEPVRGVRAGTCLRGAYSYCSPRGFGSRGSTGSVAVVVG